MCLVLSTHEISSVIGGTMLVANVMIGKTWKQLPDPNIRLALFSVGKIVLTVCFKVWNRNRTGYYITKIFGN